MEIVLSQLPCLTQLFHKSVTMSQLTIIAHIKAKTDQVALVKTELYKLIDPTRKEEGCINYHLHQDNNNPEHFLFYESWTSRDLWQKHMSSPHLADYLLATEGALEEVIIHEMAKLS